MPRQSHDAALLFAEVYFENESQTEAQSLSGSDTMGYLLGPVPREWWKNGTRLILRPATGLPGLWRSPSAVVQQPNMEFLPLSLGSKQAWNYYPKTNNNAVCTFLHFQCCIVGWCVPSCVYVWLDHPHQSG